MTANLLFLNELIQRVAVAWITAALVADLTKFTSAIHCGDDTARAFEGVRHHLFAIHIAAGFERHDGVWSVPEVGCSDKYRIEFFFFEHLLSIEVAVDVGVEARLDGRKGPTDAGFHDIAGGDVANAWDVDHRVKQHFVLLAATDEAHADVVGGSACLFSA